MSAVRSGKVEDLNADIEEGHISSALCHLGNISYRLGDGQPFSKKPKPSATTRKPRETFERMVEHLKDNKVALEEAEAAASAAS